MICRECETVAHCTKQGCIPKVRDTIDMAREAWISEAGAEMLRDFEECYLSCTYLDDLKAFEALVSADERKQIALDKKAENSRELGLDVEPVAWMYEDMMGLVGVLVQKEKPIVVRPVTPLYTALPNVATPLAAQRPVPEERKWVGLTQEEIENCYGGEIDDFARAIEAKLKAKNSP